MAARAKINSLISLLAAGVLAFFGKTQSKPAAEDFKKMEFKTSTQRLGLRFTERIRDVFRFRWIRKL